MYNELGLKAAAGGHDKYAHNNTMNVFDPDFAAFCERIYTDVAAGLNAGITAILVLSGETTMEDAEKSDVKPTYIYKDVSEILKDIKA